MSQLTPRQQVLQKQADALGREYITMVDGRIAIILRPREGVDTASLLLRIIRALEAVVDN